jgi:hypothetical protein
MVRPGSLIDKTIAFGAIYYRFESCPGFQYNTRIKMIIVSVSGINISHFCFTFSTLKRQINFRIIVTRTTQYRDIDVVPYFEDKYSFWSQRIA